MNQETLQALVGVHNTLYNMNVTGDAVIPMAQVLVALNGVIGDLAEEMKNADTTVDFNNDFKNENMEEVSI